MKKSVGLMVVMGLFFGFVSLLESVFAAPALPITKPPVTGSYLTGPDVDPSSAKGQWFLNLNGQVQEYRTHEFYDNIGTDGGGIMGYNAISGSVTKVDIDTMGSGGITNFEITASIFNDTGSESGQWLSGTNSHMETLTGENNYVGTMKDVKLTADFAIIGDPSAPALPNWIPPYYDSTNGYIMSANEDQWAWYCWNKDEDQAPGSTQTGDYYVPTWDFGDIQPGQSKTRVLKFKVPAPGIVNTDPRYGVIMDSYNFGEEILLNRTTSLKISTWIDTLATDTGQPYPLPDPKRSSDVSVFFDEEMIDFGDAPNDGVTNHYPTLLIQNGARHIIASGVMMGTNIDAEADGQPGVGAYKDDVTGPTPPPGDEDGVLQASPLYPGLLAKVDVVVSTDGYINAWMDFGSDGSWAEVEDYIIKEKAVVAGTNRLSFMVSTNAVSNAKTYVRFRFSTQMGVTNTTGVAADGEVEDYMWVFDDVTEAKDFGDAPDSYQTRFASTGAYHIIGGPWLGDSSGQPDPEVDGQPDPNALGDDSDGHDDERGVWIATGSELIRGVPTQISIDVRNNVGPGGDLRIWIDWNRNGKFDHPAEMVYNAYLSNGHHTPSITVPANAVPGYTFARCRIVAPGSTGTTPTGVALSGEIEDHAVTIGDGYVDWGRLQWPTNITISTYVGTPSEDIYGRCWHNGLTPPSTNAAPGLIAQVGYGPDGSDTPWDSSWSWFGTTFNSQTSEPNNDEYVGTVTIASTGRYDYAYRYSLNGTDWTYADADGSTGGYTNTQAGDIIVSALPPFSITNVAMVATSSTATIMWGAEARVLYQLQFATNLTTNMPSAWSNIGGEVQGPLNSQSDPAATNHPRFYRVVAPYAQ